ncbi:MAG: DUF1800 family protein [Gemmataceae bacterium]
MNGTTAMDGRASRKQSWPRTRGSFVSGILIALALWGTWPETCLGQNIKPKPPRNPPLGAGPATWNGDLSPISPLDWGPYQAKHLLERAGFGGTPEEIQRLAKMAPEQAVNFIVDYETSSNKLPKFVPSGIFQDDYFPLLAKDPLLKAITQAVKTGQALGIKVKKTPGSQWLQPILTRAIYDGVANRLETERLGRWWANRMVATKRPLEEKMTLFWHGHFATSAIQVPDYRLLLSQNRFLRQNATKSFRDILLGIAKDPATLTYLENTANVKSNPKAQFARVLIEHYSMGPKICTKKEINDAARAFTGWTHDGRKFLFEKKRHDDGEIAFLGKRGKLSGEDVIDLLLQHRATARFITRKMYRFFVRRDLPKSLETRLANHFRKGKYEIKPFLKMLFLSKDFYGPKSYATQTKSPVHLVVSTYRKLGFHRLPSVPEFNDTTAMMGQKLFFPLGTEGWKGGPAWITPKSLKPRQSFAKAILFPTAKTPDRPNFEEYPLWETGEGMAILLFAKMFNQKGGDAIEIGKAIDAATRKVAAVIKKDDNFLPKINFRSMLQQTNVETSAEAVDYFTRRFLQKQLEMADQKQLTTFLTKRHAVRLNYDDPKLEQALRGLVDLILNKREYQSS